MRSLLVHADASAAMSARLQTALALARRLDAHLTLHINTPVQRYITMDPYGGSYVAAQAMVAAQEADNEIDARLTEALKNDDVPFDITHSDSELVDALANAARLADLTIISIDRAHADKLSAPAMVVGSLAVSSRAPVLALPTDAAAQRLDGRAMVAWDGSQEAANALRGAAALLAGASAVDIVTIAEKPSPFPPIAAAAYLSRHGVHAEVREVPRDGRTIEEALDETALALGAEWLVMGAYGHSRLREMIFGGVTRYFIEAARLPLLLAH